MSNILVAGSLAMDHFADQAVSEVGAVVVRGPDGARHRVEHQGEGAIRPGEKRPASARLVEQLARIGLPAELAGGMWNTLEALTTLGRHRGNVRLAAAVHDVWPDEEILRHFWRRAVPSRTLGVAAIPCNLVFANGGDRSILRDPVPPAKAPPHVVAQLAREAIADSCVVVLNSVKNPQLFELLVEEAGNQDRPLVTTLTGSPSWQWLVQAACSVASTAVVGNWAEWRTVMTRASEHLPDVPEESAPRDVVATLPAMAWRGGFLGDVVCTLGRAGLILGEERTGRTWWVRLEEGLRREVQLRLAARPELRNGMGDWLLGAWVAHRWPARGDGDARSAAERATFDILALRGLLPTGATAECVVSSEIGAACASLAGVGG